MVTPRKKSKPPKKKTALKGKKVPSAKAGERAGGVKKPTKVAAKGKSLAKGRAGNVAKTKNPAKKTAKSGTAVTRTRGGSRKDAGSRTGNAIRKNSGPGAGSRTAAASTREKLIAVRPSGSKDDSFFDLVHEVARQIPKGRVTSYGAIGAALGTRSSARMVGWAMNACHLSVEPVPAHRVVNSAGLLTGRHHFKPPEKMQLLLEEEGIVVKDNKVIDFQKLFWDPSKEL